MTTLITLASVSAAFFLLALIIHMVIAGAPSDRRHGLTSVSAGPARTATAAAGLGRRSICGRVWE